MSSKRLRNCNYRLDYHDGKRIYSNTYMSCLDFIIYRLKNEVDTGMFYIFSVRKGKKFEKVIEKCKKPVFMKKLKKYRDEADESPTD